MADRVVQITSMAKLVRCRRSNIRALWDTDGLVRRTIIKSKAARPGLGRLLRAFLGAATT